MQESLFTATPRVEGVTRVVAYIGRLLSQNKQLAGIRVRGEVSGLKRSTSGHVYFALKEQADVLRCVMWSSSAEALAPIKNGDEIIASGEFGIYRERSEVQLIVSDIELTGVGSLFAQFEALKEKFRKEGLFEAERKRPMPAFPRRVALVSARGRGAEDFMSKMAERAPHVEIVFVETRVQGSGAEIDIAEAIRKSAALDVDAIVLTRGGGSYEDLFPFNREPVVRAIAASRRPVLSAIGHKADVHLSDLVADATCETPSNAAHYFGEIRDRFLERIARSERQLQRALRALVAGRMQRFDYAIERLGGSARAHFGERQQHVLRLERRLDQQTPVMRIAQRGERLSRVASHLTAAARHALVAPRQRAQRGGERLQRAATVAAADAVQRIQVLSARLDACSPSAPLSRGYAIITAGGETLRDASRIAPGTLVEARLERGTLTARVERTSSDG